MFKKPTVFVLGAGASWHYGYPTGDKLVHEIRDKCIQLKNFFENSLRQPLGHMPIYVLEKYHSFPKADFTSLDAQLKAWKSAAADCQDIHDRLRNVDPLVIDYFLGHNKPLQPLGKLLIAWVLRECETSFAKTGQNLNRLKVQGTTPTAEPLDNWVRFILHRLTVGCKDSEALLSNAVTFVTFNYDLSLEDQIGRGLRGNSHVKPEHVSQFLAEDRFLHVYGKLREANSTYTPLPSLQRPTGQIDPSHAKHFFDDLFRLSEGIRTIDPDEKSEQKVLELIKAKLAAAQCTYILGFGFDRYNCERIGFEPFYFQRSPGGHRKSVMFTNFGDINRVNKTASRAFFGDNGMFLNNPIVNSGHGHYFEKSERDCYGALAYDFDELEEY